ncbi:CheR family methyltransferase [Desulfurivibrio alkaliphilus]|uniref:MCP methyltransferase, CheR-type n=1 Tax=Desulfurivibrio alkaliphilus (strain DSM 19089 / UNIQEM U267 / AHT2) TaxID=589865 RepID=D6Z3A2_DESAT|nr:CheR family methyltransferase [Desulfurivibrio alkaliphilus]ADH86027.1 MCP methyltransferase, CheR-type [Desulfurivibrio alkaliphilus AHT 2]
MSLEREELADEAKEIEELEINLLLEAIYQRYGYDFRDYARAHLRRRLRHRLELSGLSDLGAMQHRLLCQRDFFEQLLRDLSINVTEMFRDPAAYRRIREDVVPLLKTYPYVKIWHAGCATGEEVYSTAILLHEEGLLERCRIYATDFNRVALQKAKEGVYPLERARQYNSNYQKSGGRASLVDYYRTDSESMLLKSWLRKQMVFADHNLVTDGVFSEMQLVVCRNVVIYFNRDLQERIFTTFHQSLCPGGFLWLGAKESLKLMKIGEKFSELYGSEKIFKKRLQ